MQSTIQSQKNAPTCYHREGSTCPVILKDEWKFAIENNLEKEFQKERISNAQKGAKAGASLACSEKTMWFGNFV